MDTIDPVAGYQRAIAEPRFRSSSLPTINELQAKGDEMTLSVELLEDLSRRRRRSSREAARTSSHSAARRG